MQRLIFSLFLSLLICSAVFPQGVIYSKHEADSLYGPVILSENIQSTLVLKYFNHTNEALLFSVDQRGPMVLNNKRLQLYPGNLNINPSDIFRVFGINKIDEFLKKGGLPSTMVELRENQVISLTNGNYTLEFGLSCPPFCPD